MPRNHIVISEGILIFKLLGSRELGKKGFVCYPVSVVIFFFSVSERYTIKAL